MFHLWFVPALILALVFLAILLQLKRGNLLLPSAMVMYGIFLVSDPYRQVLPPSPYPTWSLDPLQLLIFPAMGWWLASRKSPRLRYAVLLVIVGYLLHVFEAVMLFDLFSRGPHKPEGTWFLLGTVPFGVGIFMLALSRPTLGTSSLLQGLAKLTFGVYLSHILLLRPLVWLCSKTLGPAFPPLLLLPILYLGAVGVTFILSRYSVLRWLVLSSRTH